VTALSDAMIDLVAEMRRGTSLNMAATLIAPDYKLHPDLLVRKFHEGYPNGLPRLAPAKEQERVEDRIIIREVEQRIGLTLTRKSLAEDAEMRRLLRKVSGL